MYKYYSFLGFFPTKHNEERELHTEIFNNIPHFIKNVCTRNPIRVDISTTRHLLHRGGAFLWVDNMIRETFLPHLFFGKTKFLSPIVLSLSMVPLKKSRLRILNPVTSAKETYLSSQWGSEELIRNVKEGGAFSNTDHLWGIGEERRDRQKTKLTQMTLHSRVWLETS